MLLLVSFDKWYTDIKNFVNAEITDMAFIAIIALLTIVMVLIARNVIKNTYNVSSIKKNVLLPIVLLVLIGGLLFMLCNMRYM